MTTHRDLGPTQLRVLKLIRIGDRAGMSVTTQAIADYLELNNETIGKARHRLERDRLVEPHAKGCNVPIVLTPRGREMADQLLDLERLMVERRPLSLRAIRRGEDNAA